MPEQRDSQQVGHSSSVLAEYTPGPWRASLSNLVRVLPRGSDSPICGVHLRDKFRSGPSARREAEANAHLIAAAPAMLRALRRAWAIRPSNWDDGSDLPQADAWRAVDAAIAAAEGR